MKIIINVLCCIFIISIISGCSKKKDISSKEYYNIPHYNEKKDQGTSLTMFPILIDSTIESSGVGNFWIREDSLYYSDLYSCIVYKIRTDGTIIDRQVGSGRGPNEVISADYSIPFKNSYLLVSSSNSSMYTFSSKGQKISDVIIDWKVSRAEASDIMQNPDPTSYPGYELDFGIDGIVQPWDEKRIAVGLTAAINKFNGYFNSKLYYSHARILAIINTESGKIEKIIGRRSPVYLQHTNIPNFDHFCFDVQKDKVFVNFWPDPNIYVIDKNKDKALYSFGTPGRNMNTKYPLTQTYEEAEMQRENDQQSFGHYHQLKFDLSTGYLFRVYSRGGDSSTEGLQIYKDNVLLADVDVPIGFKVIGNINHKFYAQIDDDTQEAPLKVYQFSFKLSK